MEDIFADKIHMEAGKIHQELVKTEMLGQKDELDCQAKSRHQVIEKPLAMSAKHQH